MYIYIGGDKVVNTADVAAIVDTDSVTVMKSSREYLSRLQREGRVAVAGDGLPVACLITGEGVILTSRSLSALSQSVREPRREKSAI